MHCSVVSLMIYIRGTIGRAYNICFYPLSSALGWFAFNYDSHKMAVIPY